MNVVILKNNNKIVYYGLPFEYAFDEVFKSTYPAYMCRNEYMNDPDKDEFYRANMKYMNRMKVT